MAYFYMNASVQNRGGSSPVMRSAYISGTAIRDEYREETYNFTNKEEVIHSEVIIPSYAPQEYQDRETLWNAVAKVENNNGQTARTFIVALPEELPIEANVQMVKEYCKDEFVNSGRCVDFAVHDKEGNLHAHIMTTVRPIDEKGKWEFKSEKVYICKNTDGETKSLTAKELKLEQYQGYEKQFPYYKNGDVNQEKKYLTKTEYQSGNYEDFSRVIGKKDPLSSREVITNSKYEQWNSRVELTKAERNFEKYANHYLEQHGIEQKIDSRTYAERGEERMGQQHLGNKCYQLEQKGIETDKGNYNRKVIEFNRTVMGEQQASKEVELYSTQKVQLVKEKEFALKVVKAFESQKDPVAEERANLLLSKQEAEKAYDYESKQVKIYTEHYNKISSYNRQIEKLEQERHNCGILQLKKRSEFTEKINNLQQSKADELQKVSEKTGGRIFTLKGIENQLEKHSNKAEELKFEKNEATEFYERHKLQDEIKEMTPREKLNAIRQERENTEGKQLYSQPKEQRKEQFKDMTTSEKLNAIKEEREKKEELQPKEVQKESLSNRAVAKELIASSKRQEQKKEQFKDMTTSEKLNAIKEEREKKEILQPKKKTHEHER